MVRRCPNLTASTSYLWRAERTVDGVPAFNSQISASWTNFSVVGRYGDDGDPGDDGTDGVPGEDGRAREYVFARTSSATLPTSQRPSNTWGYDNPTFAGGLLWNDGAPNLTASTSYLWRAERTVDGVPAFNSQNLRHRGRTSRSSAGTVSMGSLGSTELKVRTEPMGLQVRTAVRASTCSLALVARRSRHRSARATPGVTTIPSRLVVSSGTTVPRT